MKIISNGNVNFFAENELEEYRVESLLTKEFETISWINDFKVGEVLFDIGSNMGQYSLYSSKNIGNKVFSFEPYIKNYNRILENIKLNSLSDKITPFYCGLSDKTSIETLFIKDERSSSSGHQIGINVDEFGETFEVIEQYPVFVFSIDEMINIFKLPIPSHIKIDVDGNEGNIIKGMTKVLSNSILKSILVELNTELENENTIKHLLSFGFTLDNKYNKLDEHSRIRRKNSQKSVAENLIFTNTK
jgi:FkbM family methyltransferase